MSDKTVRLLVEINKENRKIVYDATSEEITSALGYTPMDSALKGANEGVSELDENGKVVATQLPSFVDDVIEGYYTNDKFYKESTHVTEIDPESGKIYVDLSTEKTYRWSGSIYTVISETLALGETSSTAYRGDRGKIAYEHSQTAHAPSNAEKNQNAFANVKVGDTTIIADNTSDTLTLTAGDNITITPDATTDSVTISATDTTYEDVTDTESGLMSPEYKSKLDGIAAGANNYSLPSAGTTLGGVKSGGDVTISSGVISVNDDSHNHVISNIDGLQNELNGKSPINHSHLYAGSSEASGAATSANKLNTNAGSATNPVYFSNGVPVKTTYTLGKSVPSNALFTDTVYTHPSYTAQSSGLYKITVDATGHVSNVKAVAKSDITALGIPSSDTNTHYTSKNVVNSSNTATSNTTTALSNGNVYLISVENGAVTSAHKISGSGATTVTTDTSGNIVISSTTSLKNPYALTIQGNGKTLTNGTYDGSAAKTVNITPSSIGAAASSHTHSYLPLSGGTVTGSVTATSFVGNASSATKLATARTINGVSFDGTANIIIPRSTKHIHTAAGTEGSSGYVKIATIKVTAKYANHPVEFVISQRSRGPYHLYVQFNSVASTDPTLYEFKHFDPANKGVNAYIVKSATSTWDIYIGKIETYDHIYILDVLKADGNEGASYSITYTNVHASSVPTTNRTQSTAVSFNGNAATATALTTSAGSATQPVYFSNGKPVATTYTLGKSVPSNAVFTDTKYTHPTTSGNKHIPSGGSSGQILRWSADGTAVWGADNNTTYTDFVKSGSSAAHGLVPAPPKTAGTTKYLREDGTWVVPPNTNTDVNVTQTNTTTNSNYRLLLSNSANNTSQTSTTRKSTNFLANPSTGVLTSKYLKTSQGGKLISQSNLNNVETANVTVTDLFNYKEVTVEITTMLSSKMMFVRGVIPLQYIENGNQFNLRVEGENDLTDFVAVSKDSAANTITFKLRFNGTFSGYKMSTIILISV